MEDNCNRTLPMVINIGRQIGSGGRIVARMLADEFGCSFYDKELLNLAARESGFSEKFFEQTDEHKGFLKSLFHINASFLGDTDIYRNNFSEEGLFLFQSEAIRKAADNGPCVFVGRCADYVLRDRKDTVSIFVTARLDHRIQRVCQRLGCDRATARKIIGEKEDQRARYYNYYTGKKWGQASSYDLCVDSSLLGVEATARFVADFVRRRFGMTDCKADER